MMVIVMLLKVDAPIVEGSFIAAVKLSIGGSIDDAYRNQTIILVKIY